jgi:hypothetical protein
MEKKSSPSKITTETKFADHTVIVPPNRLKRVINRDGPSTDIATDGIFRAEAALEELKSEFVGWMNQECEALENARETLKVKGASLPLTRKVFRAALDVKGQAALFGYPLAGRIAGSLCRLISDAPDPLQIPVVLIDRYVDAVRAVVREGVHQDADKTGTEIHHRIAAIVEAFLSKQLGEGYAEIAAEASALPMVSAPKL